MKNSVILIALILFIVACTGKKESSQPIKVSYVVQNDEDSENDLITIVMRF